MIWINRLLLTVEQLIHRAGGGWPEGHATATQSPGAYERPHDEAKNDSGNVGQYVHSPRTVPVCYYSCMKRVLYFKFTHS